MTAKARTESDLKKLVDAYRANGNNVLATSRFLKIPHSTIYHALSDARARGMLPQRVTKSQIEHARAQFQIDNGVILVASDAHYYPGDASVAHRAFLQFCRNMKPTAVVMNGDVFDGAQISRHPRIGWDNKPTVQQELEAVEERLQEIQEAAGTHNLFWPMGNHDARYETFLAANAPQFQGVDGFSLKDKFPEWHPCWGLFVNDDVVIKHRHKGGLHATTQSPLWSGRTTVCGHLHSLQVRPLTDYNGTRYGVDCGTLADLPGEQFEDYLESNPVNWRSGFVVLTFWRGTLLWPELVSVVDDSHVQFRGVVGEV